ncbi:hypothetical protein POM88_047241 [Heracleum sosnowskyi]|uniref:Late embryogenesis abundant protein LEA-2 subgroup domain-containing protein n=1 Tax=Heracleum sosnowskyi TaxID=360622 RepID=A0AAD8LXC7_9APIA|nr:hypothetical protein POM88_047241 [Heracleum sosnowskyi]
MTKVHPTDPNTPVAIANTDKKSFSRWRIGLMFIATELVLVFIMFFVVPKACQPYVRRHITTIPKLQIDSLTASNFTLSSRPNQIFVNWNVKINLETKNSHGYLSFSNMTVSIYYHVLQAGLTDVIPFDVVPLNSTTHFDVNFSGSSGLISDSIINDINGRIAAEGTLTIDVKFEAFIKKSYKGRWTDDFLLEMDCQDMQLYFGYSEKSRAQMLNPPHKCKYVGDEAQKKFMHVCL